MQEILDEYGEALLGILSALLIMGIAYLLFTDGGVIQQFFSSVADSAI